MILILRFSWMLTVNRLSLIFVLTAFVCGANTLTLEAQSATNATDESATTPTTIKLDGLVTDRKKYSFTVTRGGTQYKIKLAENASVGLKMNKPWFDMENKQVVVDALTYDLDSSSVNLKVDSGKRFPVKFPSENLFLISRFGDESKIKQFKSAKKKRLNFYLITPEDVGQNSPTKEKPYLSGALKFDKQVAEVVTDEDSFPVLLGFRYATMNGFSIAQMEPNKTQVFLTGVWADGETEIVASRVLFQPVVIPGATFDLLDATQKISK
jgi:hypothetical protein